MTDADLMTLLSERARCTDYSSRLDAFVTAAADAPPDVAMAMWQRFNALVRSACTANDADHAVLRQHLAPLVGRDVAQEPDAMPSELAANPIVVAAFGRWRASAQLCIAAHLAQAQAVSPTAVMRHTHALVAAYAQGVEAAVQARATHLVAQWRDRRGEAFVIDGVFVHLKAGGIAVHAVIRRPA